MVSGGKNIEPTGPNLLALRCFTTAGYKVVQVSLMNRVITVLLDAVFQKNCV